MAYLTKAPGKGTFESVTADGTKVPAIDQEKLEDCGPSCLGLVLRMMKYPNADALTPSMLRSASQASGGSGYRPAPSDVVGTVTAPISQLAMIMRGKAAPDTGTYSDNLAATLKEVYGYKKAFHANNATIKGLLRGATFAKPLIVNVAWEKSGAHWIVACGHKGAFSGHDSYLFSDPYYGVGWLQIPREAVGGIKQPTYIPEAGTRGHFSGWYVSAG